TVSTVQGQPLSFNYNLQQDQYEIAGGLQLEFSDNFILADFGSSSAPGIIIADGQLTQLSGTVSGTIELAKATISSQGLTVCYNRDQDQFEMYGGLAVQVPTGGTTQSLSAQMGSASAPGLVIVDGSLTQLNLQLSGGFDIYGLKVTVTDAGVEWQRDK